MAAFRDFFRTARLVQTIHTFARTGSTRGLSILLGGTGLALGWFSHGDRVALAEQAADQAPTAHSQSLPQHAGSSTQFSPSAIASRKAKNERLSRVEGSTDDGQDSLPVPVATSAPVYSAAWDDNWDKRAHTKPKAVRHLILIRHGQYFSDEKDATAQKLTQLGCEQSLATGYRLSTAPFKVDTIHHSDMTRARETTQIISRFLPGVPTLENPLLAEGGPVAPIPGPLLTSEREERFYRDGPRIEAAFRKFFHRADPSQENDSFEVIVCHANVIRYFVCRALQVAPEAWLRMSLNHCGMTFVDIKPNGKVILRAYGDSGHLDFSQITTK